MIYQLCRPDPFFIYDFQPICIWVKFFKLLLVFFLK